MLSILGRWGKTSRVMISVVEAKARMEVWQNVLSAVVNLKMKKKLNISISMGNQKRSVKNALQPSRALPNYLFLFIQM